MAIENVDDRILGKIRKALNLGQAKDDHESQTAMLLAQQMMAKHGITMEDIDAELAKDAPKEIIEMYGSKATKTQWWHRTLSDIIASNFRCYTYTKGARNKSRVVFLGLKEDTKIAREVYLYAVDAVEYFSIRYLNERGIEGISDRTKVRNDYIEGFLSGLRQRFREQVVSNQYEVLLQKDADLVERHDGMKFTKAAASAAQIAGDVGAYLAGHNDGKQMDHTKKVLK